MKLKIRITTQLLFLSTLLLILTSSVITPLSAAEEKNAKIVFYVSWYDVGKAALDGLKGIKRVSRGFKNRKEINTVYYDPGSITTGDMEKALKKAGTYIGTEEDTQWTLLTYFHFKNIK